MASPTNVVPPQPVHPRHRSFAGPIVLITIGVLFLLANTGVLTWYRLGWWYHRYWPVLIILWGVIKLVEYFNARRLGYPAAGVGVGGGILLFFLITFGIAFSSAYGVPWHQVFADMNWDEGSPFANSYDFTDEAQQAFKPGSTVQIASNNGDISVNTWDQDQIKVVAHKHVSAESQQDAKTLSDATKPGFNGSGDRLNLETNTNMSSISVGRRYSVVNNLEIFLPANASLDLNTRRGSIVIRTRTGAVKASTMRGDITVQDVKGNTELSTRHGDVRVQNVTGDVRVDGHMGNAEISNVTGEVKLDGDVTGSLRMAKIARGLQFTSSRTDLRVARLDGEITVDGEDLHASDIAGPVNLVTRSKNVHLDDVSGDLRVQTSNGTVDIHASKLPLGNMEINDHRGEVQVSVPARANFYLQATATRGEIQSDFTGVNVMNQSRVSTATGNIGSGGPRVQVITDGGSIQIRKVG